MSDKEKVIRAFEQYVYNFVELTTTDEYNHQILEQVLSLLKEQEAVEPFHRCIGKEFSLIEDSYFDYCPYCGKPISWEGR